MSASDLQGCYLRRQTSLFSYKTTCPPQICRGAIFADRRAYFLRRPRVRLRSAGCSIYAILMSRLLLILSSSAKPPAGALHQNISNPIWRFWCLHFVHVSNHGLIYPSHPDISFSSFQVEEKVFLHFFKQNGLSVFFHTAPVLFFRKRKHIIFSFQNYDLIFFFF